MSETEEVVEENTTTEPKDAEIKPDLESRARRMGWRPKDEFRGPGDRWVDAESFIERGETELPVLRERFRALDDRFSKVERQLQAANAKTEDLTKVLTDFREFAHKGEERAYSRAKRELEGQMREATAMADTARFDAARAQLEDLEKTRPEPPKAVTQPAPTTTPPPPATTPEVQTWVEENQWFNRDPVLAQYATAFHSRLSAEHPGMPLMDNLNEVKRLVMEEFPEKFGVKPKPKTQPEASEPKKNPNRDKPSAVATSSSPAGNNSGAKKRSYSDLPQEAKAVCDRYLKEIPGFTKDEYCKIYYAGEDE